MKSTKAQITLVLTLKDRPEYTKRWLQYHTEKFSNCKILIADGSLNKKNLRIVLPFIRGKYCAYYNFGPDNSLNDYQVKLSLILKRVNTPFVLLCDNDDFLNENGVNKCYKFLIKNRSFSSCRGIVAYFRCVMNNAIIYKKEAAISFESSDSKNRLLAHFKNYHATWYSLMRKEFLNKWIEILKCAPTTDAALLEFFQSFLLVKSGKIKVLKTPFLYRQNDSNSKSSSAIRKSGGQLTNILEKKWSNQISIYCDILKNKSKEKEQLVKLIKICLKNYLKEKIFRQIVSENIKSIRGWLWLIKSVAYKMNFYFKIKKIN